jgi:hypothetical protein
MISRGRPQRRENSDGCHDAVGISSIDPIELIAGSLPRRQQRLVEAWAELHQDELVTAWRLLQNGAKPIPIEPLK